MNNIKQPFFVLLVLSFFSSTSCKKKDGGVTLPEVTTTAVSNVTTTGATSGGNISSNGGSTITTSGIAWSKTSQSPLISDDTVRSNVTSGTFVIELSNLDPSATYYIRAFAVNSAGVGYGDVVTFNTGNAPPGVSSINIAGLLEVDATLTAEYAYADFEGDPEGSTTFQWYRANDAAGGGEATIPDATAKTYRVVGADAGKYLRVGIIPVATAGTLTGVEVKSYWVGGIGEANSVTFTYNGEEVTYGIITSSVTGRKWLDRSLGAANTPTAMDDWANWGHTFQWGRGDDGHQVVTRTGFNTFDGVITGADPIGTSADPVYSSTDDPGHAKIIIMSSGDSKDPWDWRRPQNDNLWQGVNGINNPCPHGWHVPTQPEWEAENILTAQAAFNQLKLTYNFARFFYDDMLFDGGVYDGGAVASGYYWTSTVVPLAYTPSGVGKGANLLVISTAGEKTTIKMATEWDPTYTFRSYGYECRCIKDL